MTIIKNLSLFELKEIYTKIKDIKTNLKSNQKLLITLDTETTGKYYNKFQIENTNTDIVDKIIEFGAIFSIENIDEFGFKTIIPIIVNDIDYGFRIFFNPFIDNHKPFHIKMPDEAYEVHKISLDFLEGNAVIDVSNEKLEEPAPSLLKNYELEDNETTSYIKELIYIINSCDTLIAHNANFDVGMINEAINDYNKIEGNERLPYCSCLIYDTLKLFKNIFPKEKLIAMQEENKPKAINHKLDYLMYLAGIEERDVHGAYWDSKLLIDAYNVILNKYLKIDFMKNIVNKRTKYLSQLEYVYNDKRIESFEKRMELEFFNKIKDETFIDFNKVKFHLEMQLDNINKQKKNLIKVEQIDNSILYYKAFLVLNENVTNIQTLDEKFEKMTSKPFDKMIKTLKETKILSSEDIMVLEDENPMSNYLSEAVYHYFKYKFEKEILIPNLLKEFDILNEIIFKNKEVEIEIEKDSIYEYFRTDGSIATKDNSLTTIIGSISNVKKFLGQTNSNQLICMDFNSMVNYLNVEKYLKAYNESTDDKKSLSYGLTTLLKLPISEEMRMNYNTSLEFLDFELNIICKNEIAIKMLPNILKSCYTDKFEGEESYKDPYLSLEQFKKLNENENFILTFGSYKGLIERVLFDLNINNKREFIKELIDLINQKVNIEVYPSDPFLLEFKSNLNLDNVEFIFTKPNVYLEGDEEYHKIRCYKYNDNIYQLNNINIFDNFKLNII